MSVVVHVDGDISIYRAGFYTKDVVETQYKKAPANHHGQQRGIILKTNLTLIITKN